MESALTMTAAVTIDDCKFDSYCPGAGGQCASWCGKGNTLCGEYCYDGNVCCLSNPGELLAAKDKVIWYVSFTCPTTGAGSPCTAHTEPLLPLDRLQVPVRQVWGEVYTLQSGRHYCATPCC